MARETLRELDADTTRLLVAGASLAQGDEGLTARRGPIKELATKAPALAALSTQLEALMNAAGRKSASELLNLATMTARIRGAQAKPAEASAGALETLAARQAMLTPLGSVAADKLYKVFIGKSDEPESVLEAALKEDAVVDLRFARLVNNLIGGGIDDEIIVKAIKAYGEEAVRAVERDLDMKGGYTDATRLQILVAVRGKDAMPLIEKAFSDGSPEVRAEALSQWNTLDPKEARSVALSRGVSDKASDVVSAAITILGQAHDDDEALDALLLKLADEDHGYSAQYALREYKHPKLSARLLAAFTPELRSLPEYKAPKAKKGAAATGSAAKAAKKEEEKRLREHQRKLDFAAYLIQVMGEHLDDALEASLFETWKSGKSENIRCTAGEALAKTRREDIRKDLEKGITSKNWREREIAISALTAGGADAIARVKPYFDPKKARDKTTMSIASSILDTLVDTAEYDDDGNMVLKDVHAGWGELILPLLDVPVISSVGIDILSALKHPAMFTRLEEMMIDRKKLNDALEGFEKIKDPRALPLIMELFEDKKLWTPAAASSIVYPICAALRALDDAAAAPALRAAADKLEGAAKKGTRRRPEWTVTRLRDTALYLERAR